MQKIRPLERLPLALIINDKGRHTLLYGHGTDCLLLEQFYVGAKKQSYEARYSLYRIVPEIPRVTAKSSAHFF